MPDAFEIIVPTTPVALGSDRTATVTADVTSRISRNTRTSIEVLPAEDADPSWFGPPDPSSYAGQVGETQKVQVPITVPDDVAAGTTTFRVRAWAEDRPSEDYTESSPVQVAIPELDDGDGIPRWVLAAVALLVVALLGGGLYLLFSGGDDEVDVPALVALTTADAEAAADDIEVRFFRGNDAPTDGEQCVLFQYPPSGSEEEPRTMSEDSAIVAITVPCPDEVALTPATVPIATEIVLHGEDPASAYENLCAVAQGTEFCTAIVEAFDAQEGDGTGVELLVSGQLDDTFRQQEALFRAAHSERVVPDLVGLTESQAAALLDLLELDLEITEVLIVSTTTAATFPPFELPFTEVRCDRVLSQDPDAGTPPEEVADGTVRVAMRQRICRIPVIIDRFEEGELELDVEFDFDLPNR